MEETTEYNFNYLINKLKQKYSNEEVDTVVSAINHTVKKSDGEPLTWEQKCLLLYLAFKGDKNE